MEQDLPSRPRAGRVDPPLVLHMLCDGTQASITFADTKARLTGL